MLKMIYIYMTFSLHSDNQNKYDFYSLVLPSDYQNKLFILLKNLNTNPKKQTSGDNTERYKILFVHYRSLRELFSYCTCQKCIIT